jgi:Uma2 family endonuclease
MNGASLSITALKTCRSTTVKPMKIWEGFAPSHRNSYDIITVTIVAKERNMALPDSAFVTEQEYLAFEANSETKHEYTGAEIIAMSGASREHNLIALNISTSLNSQLAQRPCEVYQSDMRVQVKASGTYRYPDISVVCDTPIFANTNPESLLNPTVLIEVLSSTTAITDRIQKLREYRRIPSLHEYLLISQDSPRVERYLRQDDINWLYTDLSGLEQKLELPSIGCVLQFSDIYRKVNFKE